MMVWLAALVNVTGIVAIPLLRRTLVGAMAPLLLLRVTVPLKPLAVLLPAPSAVMVKPNGLPAVAADGALITSWVGSTGPGLTVTVPVAGSPNDVMVYVPVLPTMEVVVVPTVETTLMFSGVAEVGFRRMGKLMITKVPPAVLVLSLPTMADKLISRLPSVVELALRVQLEIPPCSHVPKLTSAVASWPPKGILNTPVG